MSNKNQQDPAMELLAPAGSFGAFKAALDEGADAVYVGAPSLNARALARDFTYGEIDALVREAHRADVKVYIAMNSLVKENELGLAGESLALIEEIGADGLIIQDLGLLRMARTYFPGIALHASTLMSVHNSLAVNTVTELGVKRVVLPRELTIGEIKEIHRKTGAELEVFVHGAMCFSYSGLCLFSSMHGGKSSLRGKCVQPCRRRYLWQTKKGRVKQGSRSAKDGGYLFSMNDLCGIDILAGLRDAGVASLKIEGRLKSAEYVRKTVRAYRLLLDERGDEKERRARTKEAQRYLDEAMSRRRSSGFFLSSRPDEAVTPAMSGNIGLPVGKVVKLEVTRGKGGAPLTVLSVELGRELQLGDRLRLHDKHSGERAAFTLRAMKKGNRPVKHAAGGKVQILVQDGALKFPGGKFSGSLFKVDVSSGRNEEKQARSFFLQKAGRSLQPDNDKIEAILQGISGRQETVMDRQIQPQVSGRLPLWVRVRSLRDRQYRLPFPAEKYIVPLDRENMVLLDSAPPKSRHRDRGTSWLLPPVILEGQIPWYERAIRRLRKEGFDSFHLGHFSQQELFADDAAAEGGLRLFANYTCNVLNSLTLRQLEEMHFAGVEFSLETDAGNLEMALQHFRAAMDSDVRKEYMAVGMYAYGHPPLFTARLDDSRYRYGNRFVSPRGEVFVLERGDEMTMARPVVPFSLLGMQKELVRCGINYLVIDISAGNVKRNISELIALTKGRGRDFPALSGNFQSGLL